jgi:hypothetical protein
MLEKFKLFDFSHFILYTERRISQRIQVFHLLTISWGSTGKHLRYGKRSDL